MVVCAGLRGAFQSAPEAVMQKDAQIQASTYARHIAAKVAADLKRLQVMTGTGVPSDEEIAGYQKEMSLLLHGGYLGEVIYGLKVKGRWILAYKYRADDNAAGAGDGSAETGNTEGKQSKGDSLASCLAYSSGWQDLPKAEQKKLEKAIPLSRTLGMENALSDFYWVDRGNYKSGDLRVRCMFAGAGVGP